MPKAFLAGLCAVVQSSANGRVEVWYQSSGLEPSCWIYWGAEKLAGDCLFCTIPCSCGWFCTLPPTWSDLCEEKKYWPPNLMPVPGASSVFIFAVDGKQHFWSFLLAAWPLLPVHFSPVACPIIFPFWQCWGKILSHFPFCFTLHIHSSVFFPGLC